MSAYSKCKVDKKKCYPAFDYSVKLVRSCLGYIRLWLQLASGVQIYELLFVRNEIEKCTWIRNMTKIGKKYLVVKHKQKYTHIIVYFTRKLKKSLMG